MVGTLLTKYGYDVVGTVDSPLSASSIPYYKAPAGKIVLAIDSLLGTTLERGMCQVSTNPLKPGAGVGKELPEIGDFHLAVCIGKNHGNSFFNNQELKFTSWNVISPLVNEVVQAIVQFVPPPLALDEVAAAQDF
jgi:putative sporulation protein YyaC